MVIHFCPRCNQSFAIQPGIIDFVHICHTGNLALDQEDIIKLDDKHWNLLGLANKASLSAQVRGLKMHSYTRRGVNAALYRQQQHEEYILLEDNKMLGGK